VGQKAINFQPPAHCWLPRPPCSPYRVRRIALGQCFVRRRLSARMNVRFTSTPAGRRQRIFYAEPFATTMRAISGLSRLTRIAKLCGRNGLRIDAEGRTIPRATALPDLPSTRLGGLLCESAEGGIGSGRGSEPGQASSGAFLLNFIRMRRQGTGAVIGPKMTVALGCHDLSANNLYSDRTSLPIAKTAKKMLGAIRMLISAKVLKHGIHQHGPHVAFSAHLVGLRADGGFHGLKRVCSRAEVLRRQHSTARG
jgi:hypothetical protein